MENNNKVNEEAVKEISGFIPTCDELLQIVEYWAEQELQDEWFFFNTGNTGGREVRTALFARKRYVDIAKLLGEESVQHAIDAVCERLGERNYGRLWQIYLKGPRDQWDLVADEYQRRAHGGPEPATPYAFASDIILKSPSFKDGEAIPNKYACTGDCCGEQISPPLAWTNIPKNTKSLTVIMDDLDGSDGPRAEWLVYNIPPDQSSLPENMPKQERLQNGILQGKNDLWKIGYHGPHLGLGLYGFKIYALDQILDPKPGIFKKELHKAMLGHILDEGHLTAIYHGKPIPDSI